VKLLRLRVRGLRSFTRETEIDLARLGEQGLFAISGPTGAGKSTILDGIFLALFGKSPRGEASECVSAGALELTVRLELSIDRGESAREIAVERRFRWSRKREAGAGAVGGELRGAGKHPPLRIEERSGDAWTPVDLGGKNTSEVLAEQIVKVSMSDFQQAVVLPQGQFDALLRARPAERRTLVASLFRTEHLGQPLIEVLRAREASVRSEMDRLEEAEREVAVSEAQALAAAAEAEEAEAQARAGAEALAATERRAALLRLGRQRCAARDEAAAALAGVERALAARAPDRARVERGRRAAGAEAAVRAVAEAEEGAEAALSRASSAEQARDAAEESERVAARSLAEASEARAAELPGAMERLGRARQALDRGRDLGALDAAEEARSRELAAEDGRHATAQAEAKRAAGELAAVEAEERAAAEALDRTRVGEDERAEAVAAAAEAEHAAAEERLGRVIAAELAAAEEKLGELGAAIAAAEDAARAAEVEAEERRAELRRLSIDAERAALEVEQGEHALEGARRRAAAAELAAALRPGDACPVCGAREHPGADHGAAAAAVSFAERALGAAQRIARAAERAQGDATRQATARDEEARAIEARIDALSAELAAAREAAERQAAGTLVPRAVAEARAAASRAEARAELALGALPEGRREAVRAAARREPPIQAEARVTALNRRAREAEQLERALGAARRRLGVAREERAARGEALDRAERARAVAEGLHAAAASLARARREEIRALLADLDPRPDTASPSRSAAAWVAELEARTAALGRREEDARAALEAARGEALRLALEAREASVRRAAATARRDGARAAAETAIARAGFESLDALRGALLDPAALEALAAELARLEGERTELAAVLAARRRDVEVEVSEDEALAAERARDEARLAAGASRERAAHAAARREELGRRRARSLELRARIELLEPRARRLGQIKQVVASNQLSELAAERHLDAVTRGAASLLRSLSSDRYELVRTPDGAFAVADAAHGGLVRPPSTLSGGETFLVSLALALSLSERIQLAGRTRFDFFFLDEGFGSLDQGTLETALGALERLRGPNRVIGMISHVPAIEERMPRRLRVFTERKGGATAVVHEP
jgi:exonuclease SbcC